MALAMSQAGLADRLGVSAAAVNKREHADPWWPHDGQAGGGRRGR